MKPAKMLFVIISLLMTTKLSYASQCMQAINAVTKVHKVPKDIVTAVALTETGIMQKGRLAPYPWAINVEGKGYLFASKDEAIGAVKKHLAAGKKSIDIGCMQLNWYWHGEKFNHSLEKAFDPYTNITVGAKYILEHYGTYKNWTKAVGRYHSGTSKFASQYQKKFLSNLKIAQANLGIITQTAPVAVASIGEVKKYNDDRYDKRLTERHEYKFAMLNQSHGALIKFEQAENEDTALIKLPDAPVPILDTSRKRSLFQ
jgi:soluble lytic murein transglycosylase-like protein